MIFLYLYIITIYIRPQDWVPGLVGLPTALILIPLGLIAGLRNYHSESEFYNTPQAKLFVFYLMVIFISTFLNEGFSVAYDWTFTFLQRVMVFFMVIYNINSVAKIRNVLIFILICTLFLGYQAILQAWAGQSWGGLTPYPGYSEIRVRWYGDWDGPNVFGILFLIGSAISIEYIFGKHSFKTRLANVSILLVFMLSIFYTNSRGAVLAFICGVIFYFRDKLNLKYIPFIAGLLVVMLVMAPSRMTQVSSSESSAGERTWLWEQGLVMLEDNPVFGVGRGQFSQNTDLKLIAHNNYVQNFGELGLAGFFLFISIVWFTFKGSYLISSRATYRNQIASYGRMMTLVLVMYSAATFFVVMELDLFYFIIGVSTSIYLVARREHPELMPLKFTRFDLSMVLGGMMAIIIAVWLASIKEIV